MKRNDLVTDLKIRKLSNGKKYTIVSIQKHVGYPSSIISCVLDDKQVWDGDKLCKMFDVAEEE